CAHLSIRSADRTLRGSDAVARCCSVLRSCGIGKRPRPRKHPAVQRNYSCESWGRLQLLLPVNTVYADERIRRCGTLSPASDADQSETGSALLSTGPDSLPAETMGCCAGPVQTSSGTGHRKQRCSSLEKYR